MLGKINHLKVIYYVLRCLFIDDDSWFIQNTTVVSTMLLLLRGLNRSGLIFLRKSSGHWSRCPAVSSAKPHVHGVGSL